MKDPSTGRLVRKSKTAGSERGGKRQLEEEMKQFRNEVGLFVGLSGIAWDCVAMSGTASS